MRPQEQPHVLIDVVIGLTLAGLLFSVFLVGVPTGGGMPKGPGTILLGIYTQAWGVLFLLSYWFSQKSHLLRGLMWVCENCGAPRSPRNALLFGALGVVMGTIALLGGVGFVNL